MEPPAPADTRRDPFGQRPLYYARAGARFVTARSVRELATLTGLSPCIDRPAAARALCGALERAEALFAEVRRVPPGHELLPDGRTAAWWQPPLLRRTGGSATEPENAATLASSARELLSLLREAVRRRLPEAATAACTLSGGIDSGGLLAIVAKERPRVRAWTLADGSAGDAETESARRLAARPGVEHLEVGVREEDLPDHAAEAVGACEDLLWNGRAVAMRLFFREVHRAGDTAVLTGTGADEVLCGNPAGLRSLPDRLRAERALALALLTPEAAACVPAPRLAPPAPERVDPLVWLQHLALHTTLPESTLPPESRGAAAEGVAVLLPYLDTDLAAFALELPPALRAGGSVGKLLLREALRGLVPEGVRTAPKAPRLAPPGGRSPRARTKWLDLYQGWLGRGRVQDLAILDHRRVSALLEGFRRLGDDDPRRPLQDAVLMRLVSLAVLADRPATAGAPVETAAAGAAG